MEVWVCTQIMDADVLSVKMFGVDTIKNII